MGWNNFCQNIARAVFEICISSIFKTFFNYGRNLQFLSNNCDVLCKEVLQNGGCTHTDFLKI